MSNRLHLLTLLSLLSLFAAVISASETDVAATKKRGRTVTPRTCIMRKRPHCCVDFPAGQAEITMYDSCMPMIPGDTCLEQTVCCVVLQGNSDAHPWVYRRYKCEEVPPEHVEVDQVLDSNWRKYLGPTPE